MTTKQSRDLKAFMQIAQLIASEDAAAVPTSPDDIRTAEAAVELGRDKLAELRRAELAGKPSNVVSGGIRAAIARLTRSEALALLAELFSLHPALQVAHRDLEHMSDDDVRSALEDVESVLERGHG